MKTLLGKDPTRNTKSLNFLDGLPQAKKGPDQRMENGLDYDTNPDAPSLMDPWGYPYKILVDSDYNEEIANPDTNGGGKPIRGQKAVMWSGGKDGKLDTWADNVKSW